MASFEKGVTNCFAHVCWDVSITQICATYYSKMFNLIDFKPSTLININMTMIPSAGQVRSFQWSLSRPFSTCYLLFYKHLLSYINYAG